MAPGKKSLFDSDDESDGGVELKINEEYAKRFEHNKKREERHRLEEKYKREKTKQNDGDASDSSDDETEDDDAVLATEELDAQLKQTLNAIRSKDPRIYNRDFTFYDPIEAPTGDDETDSKPKKEKATYLQDYHRERLLQGDTGADEEEKAPVKTYAQEQEDLKKSFQDAIKGQLSDGDSDDDDDFLKAKEGELQKAKAELEEMKESGVHPSRTGKIRPMEIDVAGADKDPQKFLSNFMESRAWVAQDKSNWQAFESDDGEDDETYDKWETAYNLRFEDPEKSNEVLKTYSRNLTAAKSVRREEKSGRQRQRELERERKEREKQERNEERARLRRLKIEEAETKLKQIKKAAGISGKKLRDEDWMKFLDDAWDNDKWEDEMNKAFGDQYYAEEEGGSESEGEGSNQKKKKVKKPKWDDDIDIKDLLPDFDDNERPNLPLSDMEVDDNEAEVDQDDEDEDGPGAKRQKTSKERKRERLASQKEVRQERSKIEALVDTKMNLDDPEILANSSKSKDVPRFAYRETWAESFGMTPTDILMAPSDAALNEFVGLKKLAHFRPDDKKAKDKKRLGKKARLRQWRRDNFGAEAEREGPQWSFGDDEDDEPASKKKTKDAEPEGESSNIVEGKSKKRKRRSGRKKASSALDV